MELYYYSRMNKIQKDAYHAMKTGLSALASSFEVPRLDGSGLQEVFFQLRLDCPEIFYAVAFHYRFYRDSDHVEMIPEYLFDKGKVKEHQKAMKARVDKLIRPAQALTEWEQELYIHDFICDNVRYDKLKKPYSHEIIGPLGQGVGVCEGIAKTVKILCDALGIWCIIAISDANPNKKIKYRHAWNVVRIGGKYYQLDVTFDNSLFYYREKKLSFTKMDDAVRRAAQAMRKGKPLVFHWRGGYLTRAVLSEILALLEQTAREKGMHARTGLNWPQSVLFVSFTEEIPMEELIVEEANEGEG